jgi:hypothetical protein
MSGRTRRAAKRRQAAKRAANVMLAKKQTHTRQIKVTPVQHERDGKKLSGFDKSRNVKIEFDVLTPEILDNVPENISATPEERIEFYTQFAAEFEAAKEQKLDASTVTLDIPWNMLDFGEEFGRERRCDLNNVARIVNNFDDHKYAAPRVVVMPVYDNRNILVDVKFFVTDGWHRRTVKLELIYRGNPDALFDPDTVAGIQCCASPVATIQEAAECFVAQNSPTEKRTMVKSDNWRARVVARDQKVIEVVNLARKYGFNAESPVNKTKAWPHFTSGDILLRMMFEFPDIGVDVVDRVLALLSNEKCVGVFGRKRALEAQFVGALCHFIAIFERPGLVHDIGIVHMLAQEDIIDKVKDVADKMSQDNMRLELNGTGGWSREENKRYLSGAAAFSIIYSRYVPPPNSKSGFWSKCPSTLRKLRHVAAAISDPIERESYIANLQGQLMSRGFAAQWPKYSAAALRQKRITR